MGGLLTTGSILAAFFAGTVALFSPCCIVFLFPSYLASAVHARRWRLLPLTFVFALGLTVVLLPVTLGIGVIGAALGRFHAPLYAAGGLLMLGLAALAFSGHAWRLPSFIRPPSMQRTDSAGVFALGTFSGIASSCCAPVLAGVMTLSALSGSLIGAATLGLTYVFGMVFPLFMMALLWDRLRLGERRLSRAQPVQVPLGRHIIRTNTVNIGVAVVLAAMGVFVLALAFAEDVEVAPGFQLAIGRWLSARFQDVVSILDPIPEAFLGIGLLAILTALATAALRAHPTRSRGRNDHDHEDASPTLSRGAEPTHCQAQAGTGADEARASAAPGAR